jgi:ribosomal protein S18 acetylase RimI-like enzyme
VTRPGGGEFIVRPATLNDAEQVARVHVASWQSAYRDILPPEFLSTLSVERRTEAWKRVLEQGTGSVLVATGGAGAVLGFCQVGPNRAEPAEFSGEVYAIYLLDEERGRGVGRALFAQGMAWLRAQALPGVLVWVLALNGEARRFYERLGGRLVAERPIAVGAQPFVEVAYGWSEPG